MPALGTQLERPRVAPARPGAKPGAVQAQPQKSVDERSFMIPGLQERPFTEQHLQDIFETIDLDKRGELSASDIRRVLAVCGDSNASDPEVDEMIRLVDHDGSKIVTLDKFLHFFLHPPLVFKNFDLAKREAIADQRPKAQPKAVPKSAPDELEQKQVREEIMSEFTKGKGLKPAFIKQIYQKFLEVDTDGSGLIGYDEFQAILGQPDSPMLKQMFNMFDTDGSGELELKEFIVGLSMYTSSSPTDKLKFAFTMYDEDQSGFIERNELLNLIKSTLPELKGDHLERRADAVYSTLGLRNNAKLSFDHFVQYSQTNSELLLPAYNITRSMDKRLSSMGIASSSAKRPGAPGL
jgi:serine/threonine-protein phosphatase 2B regulatory subunit